MKKFRQGKLFVWAEHPKIDFQNSFRWFSINFRLRLRLFLEGAWSENIDFVSEVWGLFIAILICQFSKFPASNWKIIKSSYWRWKLRWRMWANYESWVKFADKPQKFNCFWKVSRESIKTGLEVEIELKVETKLEVLGQLCCGVKVLLKL